MDRPDNLMNQPLGMIPRNKAEKIYQTEICILPLAQQHHRLHDHQPKLLTLLLVGEERILLLSLFQISLI